MKFDIKKLYKSTIKTLEQHQMEVSIALAALSMLAFVPESQEETNAHNEIKEMYENILRTITLQIERLKAMGA